MQYLIWKVLLNGLNISDWQEGGSTFRYQKIHFQIPILLHTEPRPYFNIAGSVPLKHISSFHYNGAPMYNY